MTTDRPPKGSGEDFVLAGDIGGTTTRLGIFLAKGGRPEPVAVDTYSSRGARGLESLVEETLARHPVRLSAACIGVAGPVMEGRSDVTQLPWTVSEDDLRERFGWPRVRLVNDLYAAALALSFLRPEELAELNPAAEAGRPGAAALIAPGTGLGQALLLRHGDSDPLPVASEGGHGDFAPTDLLDLEIWRLLDRRFGHVSLERVVSGPGLVNLYEAIGTLLDIPENPAVREALSREEDPARRIAELAMADRDPLCRKALERFCRILGAAAGNLALTATATGGVYLGGGIPPKILPFLERSEFMTAFTAKGRFSRFMAAIPVRVVRNDQAALLGAAAEAARQGRKAANG